MKQKVLWVVVFLVVVEGLYFIVLWRCFGNMQNAGQFGDSFGAVTALFTGLAFAGTLFAIWAQNTDSASRDRNHQKQIDALSKQVTETSHVSEALRQQLRLNVMATKLHILPELIQHEVIYLRVHHNAKSYGVADDFQAASDVQLDIARRRADEGVELAKQKQNNVQLTPDQEKKLGYYGNNIEMAQQSIRRLITYRTSMRTLYFQLDSAEHRQESTDSFSGQPVSEIDKCDGPKANNK